MCSLNATAKLNKASNQPPHYYYYSSFCASTRGREIHKKCLQGSKKLQQAATLQHKEHGGLITAARRGLEGSRGSEERLLLCLSCCSLSVLVINSNDNEEQTHKYTPQCFLSHGLCCRGRQQNQMLLWSRWSATRFVFFFVLKKTVLSLDVNATTAANSADYFLYYYLLIACFVIFA